MNPRVVSVRILGAIFISALVALAPAAPLAQAATLTVTNTNDGGAGSLRAATLAASPGDTIDFNLAYPATITLTSTLQIKKNLTISGPGAASLIIRSSTIDPLFEVLSGFELSLSGMTLANSRSLGGTGVYNLGSTVTVNNVVFTGNSAYGIFNSGGVVQAIGTAFTLNSGQGLYNISGTVTVTNSLFYANINASEGGAAYNNAGRLTIINSTIAGNSSSTGGALYNSSGLVTITGSTFSGNSTSFDGGGAIYNSHGTIAIMRSTFSGNSAHSGGGAIYNYGTLSVTNSTFYSNTAVTSGGAIHTTSGVTLTVTNSTFVGNGTAGHGGGLYVFGPATLRNTIVAGSPSGGNCSGAVQAVSTHNLSTDDTCSPGFNPATLGQLALGPATGSPAHYPLLPDSAAIDAGTNTGCPAVDQRGQPRPVDGNSNGLAVCDVGAFEFVPSFPVYLPLVRR